MVARSSVEAKFRSMAHGICKGMWVQRMLEELQVHTYHELSLLCDKKSPISITKNHVQHGRIKHVKIDRHFIKEKIDKKLISL